MRRIVPGLNLASDDFELFGLPRKFGLELEALDLRRRSSQGEVHPDRFAAEGAAAQRAAMQWSVRFDEAYRRLKDPVQRAAYLCELAGVPIDAERNTAMPTEFLMQQMDWREALDDALTVEAVEALAAQIVAHRSGGLARLARLLDVEHDVAAAVVQVRALMFVDRFAADVERRLEALEQ